MNLRRQLLLVSLLTLVLPWAGYQFIRETESALREGQQQMLSSTAMAIAESLSQFQREFGDTQDDGSFGENQIYGHALSTEPLIDGYFDDWLIPHASLRSLRGKDGSVEFIVGVYGQDLYLYVNVRDQVVIYEQSAPVLQRSYADFVSLVSVSASDDVSELIFRTEAPGDLVALLQVGYSLGEEPRVTAFWQDVAGGYRLEAKIPRSLLDQRIGVVVSNTANASDPGIRSSSFTERFPGRFVTLSPVLQGVAKEYVQPGLRLFIVDKTGWRLADAGAFSRRAESAGYSHNSLGQALLRLLLEPGTGDTLAGPDPSGREQQSYISQALGAKAGSQWYRSPSAGGAIVAVAHPVWSGTVQTGAIIMQQGTDAILSLANESLTRLIYLTLMATVVAALGLLGYARWLSGRISALSEAAERAIDDDGIRSDLPSALASDEIGDLSRSFSSVLQQLGEYNAYLRTLASKLSHELRTPLTIVTSSLENLEHEELDETAASYATRAKDGARRLQKILSAMSEASRVEELMHSIEAEQFNLHRALESTVAAYADAWPDREFVYTSDSNDLLLSGSPELIIQMLDKLVDNAVDFSNVGDTISISLAEDAGYAVLSVSNPGPPLPDKMRSQLFASMISMRSRGNADHLGLGLYIARLIAEGHRGNITADNIDNGVTFEIRLPVSDDR